MVLPPCLPRRAAGLLGSSLADADITTARSEHSSMALKTATNIRHCYDIVPNSTKLIYHFVYGKALGVGPEISAGLLGAAPGHPIGPPGERRSTPERSRPRSVVWRVAHHSGTGGSRPSGGGAGRTPAGSRDLRQGAAGQRRVVVRTPD